MAPINMPLDLIEATTHVAETRVDEFTKPRFEKTERFSTICPTDQNMIIIIIIIIRSFLDVCFLTHHVSVECSAEQCKQ